MKNDTDTNINITPLECVSGPAALIIIDLICKGYKVEDIKGDETHIDPLYTNYAKIWNPAWNCQMVLKGELLYCYKNGCDKIVVDVEELPDLTN